LIEPARLAGGAVLRSQSDARLVDLVRAGNDRAFEAIVHRYRKALLRYCGRFLSGPRAEDAVQQAFMSAYRAMCADDRAIDLRPWLYRIAHNTSLNVLRSGANTDTEQPISEEIDGVERPDQALERRESLAHVVAAVQALPPRQRDAIVLHELEGRSYDEIAVQLHVSGGAVRQLLSRARTTLRAGATAIAPEWLVFRLASGGGDPVAARVAEIVTAGGGVAVLAKAGTAIVVAGAVVAGTAERPPGLPGGNGAPDRGAAQAAASPSGGTTSVSDASGSAAGVVELIRTVGQPASSNGGAKSGRKGGSSDGRGGGRDGSQGGSSDDSGDERSGSSGGHGSDGDDREDSRGSDDSGSDDSSSEDSSSGNSGPGSGARSSEPDAPEVTVPDPDDTVDAPEPDSSGSGASGSGSGKSGSGRTPEVDDSAPAQVPVPDDE
jgi:RNA polymerase sigma factor (sigma-70 family)